MLGLYYRIWVDAIKKARSIPENKDAWALPCMIFMSLSMMLNFMLIMIPVQKNIVGYYFYEIELDFLPRYINNVVSGVILYILPVVLMNYMLIFYNHRYLKLQKKYPYYNGKLFITYFLISMLLPLVLLFGEIIFNKIKIII